MIFKYLTDNLVALTYSQLLSHKSVGCHAMYLSRRVSVQVTFSDSFSVYGTGKGEVLFKKSSNSGVWLHFTLKISSGVNFMKIIFTCLIK